MSILMCPPAFFGIEYEINPWMKIQNGVDNLKAQTQWRALQQTYLAMGENVEMVTPVSGLPDMVFSANAGLVWQNKFIVSNFKYSERKGEKKFWQDSLSKRGFEIITLPDQICFEGAGDGLFVGQTLYAGYGFRTDFESHLLVAKALDVEVVSLELKDPFFYHLDTCFSPLDSETVIFMPEAFTNDSVAKIRSSGIKLLEVTRDEAQSFVCNAVAINKTIVSSTGLVALNEPLIELGFKKIALEMGEFMKAGGGVRCLSLLLNVGN